MGKIKLAIADDHSIFRKGLATMIKEVEDVDLVIQADNGKSLLEAIGKNQPDVVLMDLKMPVMDGIEATQKVRNKYSDIKVLVLSMYDDEKFIIHMIEAGANGYLLKNAEMNEVENAIHSAIETGYYFNDNVSKALLTQLFHKKKIKPDFREDVELTLREIEILKLICYEYTNSEIAEKICLSARTVEGHRKKLLAKIGAKNTAGLVMFAVKQGYVN